jgi:hypothetical protein
LEKLKTLDPTAYSYQSELDKATKRIQTIKQYEPNFDLIAKEELLASFVKKQEEALAAKEAKNAAADAAGQNAGDLYNEMEALFRAPSTGDFQQGANSLVAADSEERLADFKKRCADFAATNPSARIAEADQYHRYTEPKDIYYEKNGFDVRIKELDNYMRIALDHSSSLVNYYVIKKYEIYWNTLEIAMPGDQTVKDNAALARKYAQAAPSPEELKKITTANNKASLDRVTVPAAVRRDAATETLFKNAFNATGWNETILKINLLDTDWHIERNSLTGLITGRYQTAAITAKNSNGDCILYTFSILQEYNGSGYQSTAKRYGHNASYMSCDKAQY